MNLENQTTRDPAEQDLDAPTPAPNRQAYVSEPEPPALPLSMPASDEQAAIDIKRVGPEGRPADASSGPGMLALEIGGFVLIAGGFAVIMGIFLGWWVGVIALVIATLAFLFNPVMSATLLRIKDRKDAADAEIERILR